MILTKAQERLIELGNSGESNYELAVLLLQHQTDEFKEYFDRNILEKCSLCYLFSTIPIPNQTNEIRIDISVDKVFIRKSILPRITKIKASEYGCSPEDFDTIVTDNNLQPNFCQEYTRVNGEKRRVIPKIGYPYNPSGYLSYSIYLPFLTESQNKIATKYLNLLQQHFGKDLIDGSFQVAFEQEEKPFVEISFHSRQFIAKLDEKLDILEYEVRKDFVLYFRKFFPKMADLIYEKIPKPIILETNIPITEKKAPLTSFINGLKGNFFKQLILR